MRKLLISVLVSVIALSAIGTLAQAKLAVVDANLVFQKSALGQKKQAELKADAEQKKAKIEALQKELDQLREQLNDPKISQEKKDALKNEFNQKGYQWQAMRQAAKDSIQDKQQQLQADFGQKLMTVISQYAHAKGFSLVIEKMGCLYNADALDITQEIIAAMDQAYPGK